MKVAHRCPGANLTWAPRFKIAEEYAVRFEGGLTISVAELPLAWAP